MSDSTSNQGLTIGQWIQNHSYAIIIAVGIFTIDFGVVSYRVDNIEKDVKENKEAIQSLSKDVNEIENLLIEQNATIIKSLENIESTLDRFQNKFDTYDENIQKFYQEYDLKKSNN